jgi:eukaryotic-like serine/threonine-protein kinase
VSTSSQPVGQTISRCRILSKIGGTGMQIVYKAEDLRPGRHIALKFFHDELAHDAPRLKISYRRSIVAWTTPL